ncbi:hypothetical protein J6590_046219 [Homalodisca vitripennis]|nr:hypothetical protein J6590_046219 [Homalodisca vitripennis]
MLLVVKNLLKEGSHDVQNKALKHFSKNRLDYNGPVVASVTPFTSLKNWDHKSISKNSRKNSIGQTEVEEKVDLRSQLRVAVLETPRVISSGPQPLLTYLGVTKSKRRKHRQGVIQVIHDLQNALIFGDILELTYLVLLFLEMTLQRSWTPENKQ